MNTIQVMILYIKDYLTVDEFEKWIYDHIEKIEHEIDKDLYLDLISTSYTKKEGIITLKNKLIHLIEQNYANEYERINDNFIEDEILKNKNHEMYSLFEKKYAREEELVLDVEGINSSKELQCCLKKFFKLSDYYGENWDALEDLLYGDIRLPYKIIIKNMNYLSRKLPNDAKILKELMIKYKRDCEILFD